MPDFWLPPERLRQILKKPSPDVLTRKILDALPPGASRSVVDVSEAVAASPASVHCAFRRLEKLDVVTYLGRGFWERVRE